MTITKRRFDLGVGTILLHNGCTEIKLTSEYNDYNGEYSFVELDYNDDGNCFESDRTGYVTASDIVGDEIERLVLRSDT